MLYKIWYSIYIWVFMSDIVTFHLGRHTEVFNPNQIWYGREIPFDLTSPAVVQRFNHLAGVLPSNPETSLWVSSDYPRAEETAKAVLRAIPREHVPELVIDTNFIEQQYGAMEGMVGRAAKEDPRFAGYFADMWNNAPPDGESMKMLQARVGGRMDEMCESLPPSIHHVVVFAHGGVNMAAFAHATGQKMIDVFQSRKGPVVPSFSYLSRLEISYDRAQKKWLDVFEYETGLPKRHLARD